MAKKLYIGVNNVAQEAKNIFVGVDNVAKEVIKGYIGDENNIPQIFWEKIEPEIGEPEIIRGIRPAFWFNNTVTNGQIINYKETTSSNSIHITKNNNGIAFYAIVRDTNGACIFTCSTIENAVAFSDQTSNPTTGSVEINYQTWYYAYKDLRPNISVSNVSPSCVIENNYFDNMTPVQIITWFINNKIYTDDFEDNYTSGQSYNLVKADIEKTVRKFLSVYLFEMKEYVDNYGYTNAYNSIVQNITVIINYLTQNAGDNDIINLWTTPGSGSSIRIGCEYSRSSVDNITIDYSNTTDGFATVYCDTHLTYYKNVVIDLNNDGTITYDNTPIEEYEDEENYLTMGVNIEGGAEYMHLSNVGLNFTRGENWVLEPEYNYSNGNTYIINIGLTFEETLDYAWRCFDKHAKQMNKYSITGMQYLKDNWLTIKNRLLQEINSINKNFTTLFLIFTVDKTKCQINAHLGSDTFPYQNGITIFDSRTSYFNDTYYLIDTSKSFPMRTHNIEMQFTSNNYTINTTITENTGYINIGAFNQYTAQSQILWFDITNFGMKKVYY